MSDDRKWLSDRAFSSEIAPDTAESHGMIGASTPMRALFAALPRIAASDSPLFIGGERGSGKNLLAYSVQVLSDRACGPFETVDCRALPERQLREVLFESMRSAGEGTLVLNEIGDLSVDLQARLLRVLRSEEIDVRIISTTDTNLERAVEDGRFREALYYQLNVLSIKVPPLRERGRDVQLLADFFLGKFTSPSSRRRVVGFSAEARLAMQQWSWPGNVRELVNRIRKAIVTCEKGPLYSTDLGLDFDHRVHGQLVMTLDEARDAAELSALLTALAAANGDIAAAAEKLETSRASLCRLMLRHRIDVTSPLLVVDADR
ncbi:MAG TPA: sigma 54-interacting transcriptional regulator [Gammaproteobacteria bacterium]